MKIKFEKGDSFLHGLNPVTKLLALVVYSISVFMFDSLEILIASFLCMLILVASVRSSSLWSFIRSRFIITFALLVFVIQIIFTRGGDVFFSVPLIIFTIDVTMLGVLSGAVVALRFITIIIASAIFVATTEGNELAYSLMRAGLPYRFGFMLVTAIRFIPVFESESSTVINAQRARGLDIDSGGIKGVIKSIRYTMLPLVVSALSKVDALVISMEGRAFGYKRTRTFTRKSRFRARDILIITFSAIIFIVLVLNMWFGWFVLPQLEIYNN
ncbi:energy-coupling factor transporter transmembrane protein EcfT [Methanocella sp. CWC-04]|uniref:Energy-coupling factor transporter transmembrane protein EcfT n=1 Tax=Methanooceanicella nereidis TaxID=2052831 RepID=A0AAP2RD17_9EURY|nr:energy-coupling factor transporter transmembrane component T [Methanocella sp. CWC-04]MCD1294032.1 energy-coupling factor transporter transmembrane protein EcfT [Methanocella sp. CWC-04]